ncbi:hypothetical protein [Stenotrophomonas humi]
MVVSGHVDDTASKPQQLPRDDSPTPALNERIHVGERNHTVWRRMVPDNPARPLYEASRSN